MKFSFRLFSYFICLLSLALLTEACRISEPLRVEPFEQGVLVLESGQSGKNSGALSFIAPDRGVQTDLFAAINQRSLNGQVRSYTEIDGKGYVVVNKVEVVESSTFRSIALIDKDVEQCRYMVAAPPQNGFFLKGYVSYWGGQTLSPGIAIVSLADRKVIGHIPVGEGPEQLTVVGDQLFVALSGGRDGTGNTVAVINTGTDQLVATIPVGDGPTSLFYDQPSGLLHVLCSGRNIRFSAAGTTTAELVRINPVSRQVVSRVSIGGHPVAGNPANLVVNPVSRTFYFLLRGSVIASPINATTIPVNRPLLNQSLTGLGVDPATGLLYGGYASDSTTKGVVRRFQANGIQLDSVRVGYVPSGFFFK